MCYKILPFERDNANIKFMNGLSKHLQRTYTNNFVIISYFIIQITTCNVICVEIINH